MSINPAKEPADVSDERFAGEIDRRVSVAPMMDGTDGVELSF
jgi:hypothetical protein